MRLSFSTFFAQPHSSSVFLADCLLFSPSSSPTASRQRCVSFFLRLLLSSSSSPTVSFFLLPPRRQPVDINIKNSLANCCCGLEISGTIPTLDTRIHQHVPGLNPYSSSIFNNKIGDPRPVFSILPLLVKGVERKGAHLDVPGTMGSESFIWTSNISSEDCRRDPVNVGTRDCYNDVNVAGQGRNFMVGWNFRNEEGAFAANQNVTAESPKDEEEIKDDGSPAAEDAA